MPTRLRTHHQRKHQHRAQRIEDRPSPSKRGYDRAWQRLRRWYLARHPFCVHCLNRDEHVPATEVDHIIPINQGVARLDQKNLQSLCKPCHSCKTARECALYSSRNKRGAARKGGGGIKSLEITTRSTASFAARSFSRVLD